MLQSEPKTRAEAEETAYSGPSMTMDGRREDPHGHASCKPSPSSKCGVPRLRPDLIPPQVLGNCRMILRRRSMAQCNGICGNYRSTGTGFSWAGPITRSKHGVQYIPSLRLLFLHKYIYVHARTYVVLYIPSGKFLKEIGERTKGLDRFELCVYVTRPPAECSRQY